MGFFNQLMGNLFKPEPPDSDREETGLVYVEIEDGITAECEYIDNFEYRGGMYAVLLPTDESADMVYVMETDGTLLFAVDDDETVSAVYEMFKCRYKDVFNFE